MIAKILHPKNLYKACKHVVSNIGSSGVDKMKVGQLKEYLSTLQVSLVRDIYEHTYLPDAIRGVPIPKTTERSRKGQCPVEIEVKEPQAVGLNHVF